MKKSIKILSLVLAVALLCAAVVIGVIARDAGEYNGVAGVTVLAAANFEDADINTHVYGTDTSSTTTYLGTNNAVRGGQFSANVGGRHGELQVKEENGNKYVVFKQGYVSNPTGGPYYSNGYNYAKYEETKGTTAKYQVIDMDVNFPTGRSITYFRPSLQTRYLNTTKEYKSVGNTAGTFGFIMYSGDTSTNSDIYILDNTNGWSSSSTLSKTGWSHVTYIIEAVDAYATSDGTLCDASTVGAIAVLDYYTYIIVNDNIVVKQNIGNSMKLWGTFDTSLMSEPDIRNIFFSELRINMDCELPYTKDGKDYNTTNYNQEAELELDNVSWRSINPDEYAKIGELKAALATGVGGSLSGWSDSLYDIATMPMNAPVASIVVDGKEVKVDSFDKAFGAVEAGGTIKLLANATSIPATKRATIDPNGYTVGTITPAAGLTSIRVGNYYKIVSDGVVDSGYVDLNSSSFYGDYTGTGNPTIHPSWTLIYKGGVNGTAHVPTVDGNNYFRYDYADTFESNQGPYISAALVSGAKLGVTNYSYHTFDFDMFLPTGKVGDSFTINFAHRNSTGSSFISGSYEPKIYMNYDDATGMNYFSGTSGNKVNVYNDKWTHVTMVVDIDDTDSGYTVTVYLSVDGGAFVPMQTFNGTDDTDIDKEVRITFAHASAAATSNAEIALDNLALRAYKADYDQAGVIAEVLAGTKPLSAWTDNSYDPTITPYGNTVATLNGVNYDSLQDAIDAASKGDTVTIVKSTNQVATVASRISIDSQGNTVGAINAATGLAVKQSGNVYTVTGNYVDLGMIDFESDAVATFNPDDLTEYAHSFTSNNKFVLLLTDSNKTTARPGTAYITQGTDNNKYFKYEWEAGTSNIGDMYIYSTLANNPTASSCPNPLSERPLHVVDFDFFSPTGKIASSDGGVPIVQFMMKYYSTATNGRAFFHNGKDSVRVYHDTTAGLNYVKNTAGDKFYLQSNAWSHMTVALEAAPLGIAYATTIHLWLDGEYCGIIAYDESIPASGLTAGQINLQEIRFNFSGFSSEDVTNNATVALDNINVRAFGTDYDSSFDEIVSTEGSITEWEDTVYDANYDMPYGNSIIMVGGTTEYDRIDKALAHDKTLDNPGIDILKDIPETITFDYATYVFNFDLYNVTLATKGLFIINDLGDGFYEVVPLENARYKYTVSGKEVIAYSEANPTLQSIMDAADAGSTIFFMEDVREVTDLNCAGGTSGFLDVSKNLILDLGGFKLEVLGTGDDAQPTFYMKKASMQFTIRNGTVVTGYTVEGKKSVAYPLVQANSKMVLTLDDCKFYGGPLTYSYSAIDCTVNITDSEIHIIKGGKGSHGSGFINGRRLFDASFDRCNFYIDDSTGANLVSVANNASAGSKSNYAINFTDCNIVSKKSTALVQYSSACQAITFTGCAIYGKLDAPGRSSFDTHANAGQGYITLGAGTVVSSYNEDTTNAVTDYVIWEEASSKDISFFMSSGALYTSNFAIAGQATTNNYAFVYKVVTAASVAPFEVKWYNQNGELIATTEVYKNTVATPPSFTPGVKVANGWWRQLYDVWSTTAGGEATDNFLITQASEFHLVESEPKPYLTAAKFNLKLMGHTALNLYLPTDIPDGIVVNSISSIQATTQNVMLDGVSYTCYCVAFVGATSIANDSVITVTFTATIDDEEVEFTQNIKLSPLRYAQTVLKDYDNGGKGYDAKAYGIVANMLRYSKTVMEYHSMSNATINSLLATYETLLCDPIDVNDDSDFPAGNMVDLGDAADYIYSVAFEIASYQPRYQVIFKQGSGVTDFSLNAIGYKPNVNGGDMGDINWGYNNYYYNKNWGVYYYDDQGQYICPRTTTINGESVTGFVVDINGVTQTDKVAGDWSAKHIAIIYSENIPIYNIDEDMTLRLTLENGDIIEGKYNIDTYYNNLKNKGTAADSLTAVRKFFKVMRDYAEAVQSYRFPNGKYPYVDLDSIGDSGSPVVDATLFGATPNDGVDDYDEIKLMFEFANSMGYEVVFPAGEYTIGVDTSGYIPIKTNVNFGDATFDLQDASYTSTANNTYLNDIFKAVSDYSAKTVTEGIPTSISAGATNIGYAPGYPAHITIYNENVYNYIRHGANNATKENQTKLYEVVLVDADGNVDESTPIVFDYSTVTKLVVRRADDEAITIKGGTFVTDVNNMPSQYTYLSRGMMIQRSNVTLEGMTHEIINEDQRTHGAPYKGFYYVQNCNNVTIKDCITQAPKYYTLSTDSSNSMGTYGLGAAAATNLTYEHVTQSNFWYDEANGIVSDTTHGGVWGIGGTNDCKNMWYRGGCILARYDAHRGMTNGGVENSTISGVSLLGHGTFTFRNNNVYSNDTEYIINLRSDYGSSWKGDMIFENINWHCTKNATLSSVNLYLISATQTNNHYFGYTCYAPSKVTISGNINVTLTGKKYSGIGGTVSLGTFYVGRLASDGTYNGCLGCDGTYGSGTSYVTGTTVTTTGSTLKVNGSTKSINTKCTAS